MRAAIIGCGLMGYWHARNVERLKGRVVALCDVDLENIPSSFAHFKHAARYTDYKELLAAGEVDVVHVCTPVASHFQIALDVLQAGFPVLIEKPFAATLAGSQKLLQEAEERNLAITPVYQFVFQDGFRRAQELFGEIGNLVHVEAKISSAGAALRDESGKNFVAIETLPHPLAMIAFLSPGQLEKISWQTSNIIPGELHVSGDDNSVHYDIHISMNKKPTENSFSIYGTEGAIHLDLFHGYCWLESGKVSRFWKFFRPFYQSYKVFGAASANMLKRIIRWEPAYPGLRRLIASYYLSVNDSQAFSISHKTIIDIGKASRTIESAMLSGRTE